MLLFTNLDKNLQDQITFSKMENSVKFGSCEKFRNHILSFFVTNDSTLLILAYGVFLFSYYYYCYYYFWFLRIFLFSFYIQEWMHKLLMDSIIYVMRNLILLKVQLLIRYLDFIFFYLFDCKLKNVLLLISR